MQSGTATSQTNHVENYSSNSAQNDDRSSNSRDPPQRFSEASQDKRDDESRKIEESDSPASMTIDESVEEAKDNNKPGSNISSEATSTQPNYEPLTDEET